MFLILSLVVIAASCVLGVQALNGGKRVLPGKGLASSPEQRARVSGIAAIVGMVIGIVALAIALTQ